MPQTSEFQFSQEALSTWDRIESLMWQKIRELSKKRASEYQRITITQEDIKACLNDAVKQLQEELEREDAPT